MKPNMKVSTQIFRAINFVHLANQTGGILHSPPTPTQGGASSSTLVMTTSLIGMLWQRHNSIRIKLTLFYVVMTGSLYVCTKQVRIRLDL